MRVGVERLPKPIVESYDLKGFGYISVLGYHKTPVTVNIAQYFNLTKRFIKEYCWTSTRIFGFRKVVFESAPTQERISTVAYNGLERSEKSKLSTPFGAQKVSSGQGSNSKSRSSLTLTLSLCPKGQTLRLFQLLYCCDKLQQICPDRMAFSDQYLVSHTVDVVLVLALLSTVWVKSVV